MVRGFANIHPERVAGVVLVDVTTTAVATPQQARQNSRLCAVLAAVAPLRLHQLLVCAALRGATLAAEDLAAVAALASSQRTLRSAAREAAAVERSLPLLAGWERWGLPHVPVTTIVGGRPGTGRAAVARTALRTDADAEMARHPCGRLVVAERSGHAVHLSEPDLVAAEVQRHLRRAIPVTQEHP